jgi:hypothetical protein
LSVRHTIDDLAPGGSFLPFPVVLGVHAMAVSGEIDECSRRFYNTRPKEYTVIPRKLW